MLRSVDEEIVMIEVQAIMVRQVWFWERTKKVHADADADAGALHAQVEC